MDIIRLNVGGHTYDTTRGTLRMYPGSMLAIMFDPESKHPFALDKHGRVFIDRDGRMFRHVLRFLRDAWLPGGPAELRAELALEARYFQIQPMIDELASEPTESAGSVCPSLAEIRSLQNTYLSKSVIHCALAEKLRELARFYATEQAANGIDIIFCLPSHIEELKDPAAEKLRDEAYVLAQWIANDWKNAGFDASFFGRTFRATWNTANTTVPKVVQGSTFGRFSRPTSKQTTQFLSGTTPPNKRLNFPFITCRVRVNPLRLRPREKNVREGSDSFVQQKPMEAGFVGNDWKLVATRPKWLIGDEWKHSQNLQVFLTAFEDGREIWAAGSSIVELGPDDNRILRLAKLDEIGRYLVLSSTVSPVLADQDGNYLVFCAIEFAVVHTPTIWQLNFDQGLELLCLGRLENWNNCEMSTDGGWIAGEMVVDGRLTCVRCRVKDPARQNSLAKAEICPHSEVSYSMIDVVDTLGGVWFYSGNFDKLWYWGIDGQMVSSLPAERDSFVHAPGLKTYDLHETDDTWRFVDRLDGIERIVPGDWWILKFWLFTSEVVELLELSTLPHTAALLSICPTQYPVCVRWNDKKSRASMIWEEGPSIFRTELWVVRAADSLLHACAAKLASAGNAFDWLPEELNTLISSFRNAGSFLRRKNS